jgi:hypothetical protein
MHDGASDESKSKHQERSIDKQSQSGRRTAHDRACDLGNPRIGSEFHVAHHRMDD